jgi:hypothetical protein
MDLNKSIMPFFEHNSNRTREILAVDAIHAIAELYSQRRLTDALDLIEGYGLIDEAALALFAIIGEVA